jgi:hypothetical protein
MQVRNQGLKVDLVLLDGTVSSLNMDYQKVAPIGDLHKWLGIVYAMLSGDSLTSGESALPVTQPRNSRGNGLGVAEPMTINMKNQGLKVDLVLLEGSVSGLSIDYRDVSKSGELQRWIEVVDAMILRPAPSSSQPAAKIVEEEPRQPAPQPPAVKEEPKVLPGSEEYKNIVLQAVDRSLNILGKDGKQVLLSLLERRYGLREEEIPEHPRGFIEILGEILGSSAYTLEAEIVSEIKKVSAAQGQDLLTVSRSLRQQCQTEVPVEETAMVFVPALSVVRVAEAPEPVPEDFSPVAVGSPEEEKPSEEQEQPKALEDPIPAGFSYNHSDPIPVGFKYNGTFARRRD